MQVKINNIEALLEKLKEVTGSYEQLTEVLEGWNLSIDPKELDTELNYKDIDYENLADEYKTLQDEIFVLKETLSK